MSRDPVSAESEAGARAAGLPPAPEAAAAPPRSWFVRLSATGFLLLVAASWVFVLDQERSRPGELLSADTWSGARRFVERLIGVGVDDPAYFDAGRWAEAARLAYQTLAMSVLAIGFATVGMLLTVVPAARTSTQDLSRGRRWLRTVLYGVVRAVYIFSRAIPELIWAMLVIFVVSPGVLAGAVALGIHNFGVLSKLCADVVEDLDQRPARALRAAGATGRQTLVYAVLPAALPQVLTFILYRWEVIIRTTIVVGFVGAGGLGREFRLSMSFFHYTDVGLLLVVYFVLVIGVEAINAGLRRLAR